MPAFHYTALSEAGEKKTGIIEAENEKQARQSLRAKKLIPLKTLPAHQSIPHHFFTFSYAARSLRLTSKELAFITRQLSTLLNSGLPLEEAIGLVAEQSEKPRIKGIILSIRSKILEGHAFSEALYSFPQAFPRLFCAAVRAGEQAGQLARILCRLADQQEKNQQIKSKIQQALLYPSMMLAMSVAIVSFLLSFVVPKMLAVYTNSNQALPDLTQALLSLSNFIREFGLYCLLAMVSIALLMHQASQINLNFKTRLHACYLRLPFIGNLIKKANTARFSRTVATLSAAGIPALEAIIVASELIINLPIKNAVLVAADRICEGSTIHRALKQTSFFSSVSTHLIANGEATGQLEGMLERTADIEEGEIMQFIDTALTLFEPIIILVMGGVILFIVLAVLLPIFQFDQLLG